MNKYTRMNWENTPSTATPLTADNLNHMDEGIERATDGVTAVEEALKIATADLTTVKSEVSRKMHFFLVFSRKKLTFAP